MVFIVNNNKNGLTSKYRNSYNRIGIIKGGSYVSFSTIMYHEIREKKDFNPDHQSTIDVNQGYEDILPSPLFVTLENFKEQMAYLYENQFHTLNIR